MALVLLAAGCATGNSKDTPAGNRPPDPPSVVRPGGRAAWPFRPDDMRIHPLSQFVTDRRSGELLIEARVEFLDDYEHTTKGVGLLVFDLYDAAPGADLSEPIQTWENDLSDLTVNLEHYDDLTRTYLFRLEIDPAQIPPEPELRAYFHSSRGRRMQDEFVLPPPPGGSPDS